MTCKGTVIKTIENELNQKLRTRYKKLFDQIITPVMVTTSIFLIASHWKSDNDKILMGIIVVCLIVFLNLAMLFLKDVPTPWGRIPARTDAFDALRWCINFPLDIYLVWSLEINIASAVSIWSLLTFGAMTEVYERKYKLITISVAFISFLILIVGVYDIEWKTRIYVVACYLSMIFTLWKLQQYISDEMLAVLKEQVERQRIEAEAETLQRNAAIGHSTRAINHELNTLIGVANISTFQIETKNNSENISIEIERLNKSLSYMGRVSGLILDGLGNRHASKRIISLAELHEDLKLLLCTDSEHYIEQLHFEFPEDETDYQFEERTGSTYLIVHNLFKNAYEAVNEKYGRHADGIVSIRATVEDKHLTVSVYDNGIGLSARQIQDIHKQINGTGKLEGHGLGLKFVKSECEKNGMALSIRSVPDEYSLFTIKIPRKA